jgi:8-oxo-dGTP pyrophosphatase MutT (NUDIX family)
MPTINVHVALTVVSGGRIRRSQAALAVIGRRDRGGRCRWLAQWNPRWARFHFVGGHRRPDESFRECLLREVAEELRLTAGTDFVADERCLARAEYTAWSERARAETYYEMELYGVRLLPTAAAGRVRADPRNRWLTADEMRAGRTTDGLPINESMARLLSQAGWPCP